jgi:hypothetical protein
MEQRVSCGLDFVSPADITNALQIATESQSLVANSVILLISSGMISLHCQSLIRDTKEISPEILKLDVSQLSLELISF